MRSVHPATAAALCVALLGCNAAQSLAPGVAHQLFAPGLDQTVRLTPAVPTSGDQLQIVSVVTNRSADAVAVTSWICGLDTGGDVVLVTARMACAGYSVQITPLPATRSPAGMCAWRHPLRGATPCGCVSCWRPNPGWTCPSSSARQQPSPLGGGRRLEN